MAVKGTVKRVFILIDYGPGIEPTTQEIDGRDADWITVEGHGRNETDNGLPRLTIEWQPRTVAPEQRPN